MPVHILGGICVALGFSILPYFRIYIPKRFQTLGMYLIVVLMVGILWELFEFFNGISLVADDDFTLDTAIDLILDLVGGAFGYYLVTRIKNL